MYLILKAADSLLQQFYPFTPRPQAKHNNDRGDGQWPRYILKECSLHRRLRLHGLGLVIRSAVNKPVVNILALISGKVSCLD